MKLSAFQIKNYKCFRDTGPITLSPGMNIVTGQNNAGKTVLLQALELTFPGAAHRSIASLPQKGGLLVGPSEVRFTISVSGDELRTITERGNFRFAIPQDPGERQPHPLLGIPYTGLYYEPKNLKLIWEWIHQHSEIKFQLIRSSDGRVRAPIKPSHNLYPIKAMPSGSYYDLIREIRDDGSEFFTTGITQTQNDIGEGIAGIFISRIYRFSAERFGLGDSDGGTNRILASNASNLPEVLHLLQPNPVLYEKYVSLVREILPQVKWVSIDQIGNNRLRINIWPIDRGQMRDDLAIPLIESGTGIGQVLSILYVVFTSEYSRVLLIDEPQSFLHPGAARKLIEVLKRFPEHQYIIGTHSASVIAASDALELLLLRNNEGQTSIEIANTNDNQAVQTFLQEVGTRLSDIFGMDSVIWVEGPTEEKTFPLLLKKLNQAMAGTAIVSIRNTGDLEGKDKKKIFEIYNNLTGKASILPSAVAFILDSESLSDTKKNDIRKLSGGKAYFQPRRTFENYLMDTDAICEIINQIEDFTESGKITPGQINEFLTNAITKAKYWNPLHMPKNPSLQSSGLNCALILSDMFAILSEHRVEYRKTIHSVSLFQWLLDHNQNALEELANFLISILQSVPNQS
jgi:hypothetical protein